MGNSVTQWRATIGTFRGDQPKLVVLRYSTDSGESDQTTLVLKIITLLLVIGGIEMNPGPNQSNSEVTQKMYDLGCKIKDCDQETELKKQADLMCELGNEYMESAETSQIWYEHYVWASGLFNAAKCRLEKLERKPKSTLQKLFHRLNSVTDFVTKSYIDQRLQNIDTNFLKRLSKSSKFSTKALTKSYKEDLERIRKYSEETVKHIINDDRAVHPVTSEMREKGIENTIEQSKLFYNEITDQLLKVYRSIITHCMSVLEIPSCKYKFSVMALGSMISKDVTAYSEIEWAILFDPMDQPVEQVKQELCLLAYYVHLQVLNLGETILDNLDIPVLTEFNDRLPREMKHVDFWDKVTTHGVSLNGTHPAASTAAKECKSNIDNIPTRLQLIMTLDELTEYKTTDDDINNGHNLSDVLPNSTLILGDETLCNKYNEKVHSILQSPSQIPNVSKGTERALKTLNEGLEQHTINPPTSKLIQDPTQCVQGSNFFNQYS